MKFCERKRAERAFWRRNGRDGCAGRSDPSSGKEHLPRNGRVWRAIVCLLFVLLGCAANCLSLDREAFTFTNYDLNVRLEPEQHRLGVRGTVTLRNGSQAPQKIAVLQISSSLDWRSIRAGDKAVQFVTQPLTSDIDHTGGLSEAIVTLPQAVPPGGTIDLDIAYEGVILPDATRLTRIGMPEDTAKSNDWDQIGADFTGVRGAGYVAWYPIATEIANLSDANNMFEVLGRWKAKEAGSKMHLKVTSTFAGDPEPKILLNGIACKPAAVERTGMDGLLQSECNPQTLGLGAPTLLADGYVMLERPSIEVFYSPGHEVYAGAYADAAEKTAPLIAEWFGKPAEKAKTVELPISGAEPFESGALMLMSFTPDSKLYGLSAAHQLTHASFTSFRPWIEEGLAHFAQALYLEQQKGRQAAIDYMASHRSAIGQSEQSTKAPTPEDEVNRSLVHTTDEELYRSKAMCVWWMLRDMAGDEPLKKALANYRPEDDKDPAYMQRLIMAQTPRDLQWFFDDWVYHDRGLPNFKVESAFARKALANAYIVTVTVDDLGAAGAEVPITVKFAGGEVAKRLEVHAKNKAVIRIETPNAPLEVVVNDGSVPEIDMSNNVFKIETVDGSPASKQ
jgi:hypothetical protein